MLRQPMLEIIEKKQVGKSDLKCLDSNPLIVGGDERFIYLDGRMFELHCPVSAIKNFEKGVLYGLSDGTLGFIDENRDCKNYKMHNSKICSLKVKANKILTGSWDHYVNMLKKEDNNNGYEINSSSYSLKKFLHPATVWSVDFLGDNTFVTGCADNNVRIFSNSDCIKTLEFHNNVVRGVLITATNIFSIDNYGVIMKYSKTGILMKLRCLNEMTFNIIEYKDLLVVCGGKWKCIYLRQGTGNP